MDPKYEVLRVNFHKSYSPREKLVRRQSLSSPPVASAEKGADLVGTPESLRHGPMRSWGLVWFWEKHH